MDELERKLHALLILKHLCEWGGLTNEAAYYAEKAQEVRQIRRQESDESKLPR